MMTDADIARAIEIIEEHRAIHLDYADWQEGTPDWQAEVVPDQNVGGPNHHRACIAKYDHVLAVLRSIENNLTGSKDA